MKSISFEPVFGYKSSCTHFQELLITFMVSFHVNKIDPPPQRLENRNRKLQLNKMTAPR